MDNLTKDVDEVIKFMNEQKARIICDNPQSRSKLIKEYNKQIETLKNKKKKKPFVDPYLKAMYDKLKNVDNY